MKTCKVQQENKIFALHYKGKLIGSFKWSDFGPNGLYGWRPPKKVYWALGLARSGAGHLPIEILDDVEIVEYIPSKVVEKLSSAAKEKRIKDNKIKKLKSELKYYVDQRDNYAVQDAKTLIKYADGKVKEIEAQINQLSK